eukprot:4479101-Pyramimonas_sp.AAC.1
MFAVLLASTGDQIRVARSYQMYTFEAPTPGGGVLVKTSSWPLFSVINHVYEAHGLPRIALGTL